MTKREIISKALFQHLIIALVESVAMQSLHAQNEGQDAVPAYRNPSLPIRQRVDDLIARITLEEKVRLMRMPRRPFPGWAFPLMTGGTKRCMVWRGQGTRQCFPRLSGWQLHGISTSCAAKAA